MTRQVLAVSRSASSAPNAGSELHQSTHDRRAREEPAGWEPASRSAGHGRGRPRRRAVPGWPVPASPRRARPRFAGLAATALQRATLTRTQLFALVPVLESAGPLELARLLQVFDEAGRRSRRKARTGNRERARPIEEPVERRCGCPPPATREISGTGQKGGRGAAGIGPPELLRRGSAAGETRHGGARTATWLAVNQSSTVTRARASRATQ